MRTPGSRHGGTEILRRPASQALPQSGLGRKKSCRLSGVLVIGVVALHAPGPSSLLGRLAPSVAWRWVGAGDTTV
jgi:hypothetical protein